MFFWQAPCFSSNTFCNSFFFFFSCLVHSAEHTDSSRHSKICDLFIRRTGRRHKCRFELGKTRPRSLLCWINFRTHRPTVGFHSPHSHAFVEQHILVDCFACDLHATPTLILRNSKTNKKASKLSVGFESHETKVSNVKETTKKKNLA